MPRGRRAGPGRIKLTGNPAAAARLRNPISIRRQIEWLRRSKGWKGLPREWKARKVLGAGSYGICGLFEYTGDDAAVPSHMVVKQGQAGSLTEESRFLRLFASVGAEHIVKLYKDVVREGGSGTTGVAGFDPHPFSAANVYVPAQEIDRMFMEYCPGGDLSSKFNMPDFLNINYDVPEEYVWRTLDCFASALMMMKYGSEHVGDLPWNELPVVHFDIKPANVLVGEHDNDKHKRLAICKLADFGISLQEPPPPFDDNVDWIDDTRWRGTLGYLSPEQLYDYPIVVSRRVGNWTNIWACGAIIYRLMTSLNLQAVSPNPATGLLEARMFRFMAQISTLPGFGPLPEFYRSFGEDLIESEYSRTLVELVHRILAWKPMKRPGPRYIKRRAREALRLFDDENERHGDFDRLGLVDYQGDPPDPDAVFLPPGLAPFPEAVKAVWRPPNNPRYYNADMPPTVAPDPPAVGARMYVPPRPNALNNALLFSPHQPRQRAFNAWPWQPVVATPAGPAPAVVPPAPPRRSGRPPPPTIVHWAGEVAGNNLNWVAGRLGLGAGDLSS